MMSRITITVPATTLRLLDARVPEFKRSQFLTYAARLALAKSQRERDQYMDAIGALLEDG